jgi:hypothetical protein
MDEQVPKAREIKHLTPAQSMLSGQIICELPRAPLLIRSRTLRKPKTPNTRSAPAKSPLSNGNRKLNLETIRKLIGAVTPKPHPPLTAAQWLETVLGIDPMQFSCCGGRLENEKLKRGPIRDPLRQRRPVAAYRLRSRAPPELRSARNTNILLGSGVFWISLSVCAVAARTRISRGRVRGSPYKTEICMTSAGKTALP